MGWEHPGRTRTAAARAGPHIAATLLDVREANRRADGKERTFRRDSPIGREEMDYAKILSYGAIGLGFLLAILAYRLLRAHPGKERPIYVFMGFCIVLVLIGSILQYATDINRS